MSVKYIKKAESRKQKAENRKVAEVVSAVPLNKAQERQVAAWVERNLGEGVGLTKKVDPKVIAGIRLKAGDWLFDATFKGELERVRNTLLTG